MRFLKTKKGLALVATLVVAVSAAIGAYAYFTTGGSGTGSVQVGTSSSLTIAATITPAAGGLVPDGTPADVEFSATNPSTGTQYVTSVSLTGVEAYSDAAHTTDITGTGAGQCDTSAFTMATVAEGQPVANGTHTLATHGSLVFNDSGDLQDACKSAYLVASFSSV